MWWYWWPLGSPGFLSLPIFLTKSLLAPLQVWIQLHVQVELYCTTNHIYQNNYADDNTETGHYPFVPNKLSTDFILTERNLKYWLFLWLISLIPDKYLKLFCRRELMNCSPQVYFWETFWATGYQKVAPCCSSLASALACSSVLWFCMLDCSSWESTSPG